MSISKVLLIEDSEEITEAISIALNIRWPLVTLLTADRGEKGLNLVAQKTPDVVILDIGLPDMSGFDVLKQIRLFSEVPVIILTVRKDEADVVKGLELGADEYIIKPFRQLELLSRIQAVTRRLHFSHDAPLVCGKFCLDLSARTLAFDSSVRNLTRTESAVLVCLMKNKGNVITHNTLAEAVWGIDYPDASSALKVYIRRLREKIELDHNHPQYITTRSGIGYMFDPGC